MTMTTETDVPWRASDVLRRPADMLARIAGHHADCEDLDRLADAFQAMRQDALAWVDWETLEVNTTGLAERAADMLNHDEWLDDETHWVWDLAVDVRELVDTLLALRAGGLLECPSCHAEGPHDDNHARGEDRVLSCSECGAHFGAYPELAP